MGNGIGACNLCGSGNLALVFPGTLGESIGERFAQYALYADIYRCRDCGLMIQSSLHDSKAIAEFLKRERYTDEEIGQLALKEKHVHFEEVTQLIRGYRPLEGKRLLDVGTNTGVFLTIIRDHVANATGIEPSEEAAGVARQNSGCEVQSCLISEVNIPDSSVDLITMFDVIEHLTNPSEDLKLLYRKTRLGGAIFITTYDIKSTLSRISGRHYPFLMYQHFFHFTPRTLGKLLEKAGFHVIGVKYFYRSWSIQHIYHVMEKLWPSGSISNAIRFLLRLPMRSKSFREFRLVIPLREFFMISAERR